MKTIERNLMSKLREGAGMVEYALVLVLVAVATMLILSLTGVGIQRIYGIVGGMLGVNNKSKSVGGTTGQLINITGASCYMIAVGSSYAGALIRLMEELVIF